MFNKNRFINIFVKILFVLFDLLFFSKNKKLWVICIHDSERFDGNARAFYEYFVLHQEELDFDLKIIAGSSHKDKIYNENFVSWGSYSHIKTLLNAGVVIYHHNVFETGLLALPINRVNYRVGHGIHYKSSERAVKKYTPKSLWSKLTSMKYMVPYQAVSSKQDAMAVVCVYHVYLYNLDIIGSCRNDVLLGFLNSDYYQQGENKLVSMLNGKKLVTYAPTWRNNGCAYSFSANDIKMLEEYLHQNNMIFGYAGHQYLKEREVPNSPYFIDLNALNLDIQVILKCTDILVTDYSSVWIDFLLLKRKIILFQYDSIEYKRDREVIYDEQLIGVPNIAFNVNELVLSLKSDEKYMSIDLLDFFHVNQTSSICEKFVKAVTKKIEE